MITSVAEQESMSRKKKQTAPEDSNPMVVDKAEFTDVIRRMVNTPPVTREEVEKHEKRRRKYERRKNPETDPRYLPVFDFSRPMKLTPEQEEQVRQADEFNRKLKERKRKRQ
jgi:hypothetical protein